MCTDKTLKAKIAAYEDIAAQIAELENEKKKLSDWIIAEYDSRQIEKFNGLGIVNQSIIYCRFHQRTQGQNDGDPVN